MSAHVYVIEGRPVSGKNHTEIVLNRKTGKRFVRIGKRAREWQVDAIRQLVEQRGRRSTLRSPVYVEYVAYQTSDLADIDNLESALFDALKKALVIEDDKLIQDHRGRKAIDSLRPRFEITVRPLSEAA